MDQSPSSEGTISFTGQEILCSYHPIFAKVLVLIIKVLPELANCVFRIQEIAAQPLRRAVSLTVAFTVSDKSWGVLSSLPHCPIETSLVSRFTRSHM